MIFSLNPQTQGLKNKQNELLDQNKNCKNFEIDHVFSPSSTLWSSLF